MNRLFNVVILLSLFVSPPARADEEAVRMIGGVALGLLGLAVEEGQKQAEQSDVQKDAVTTAPKLQYSDEVAEIQLKLKKISNYNGKIDGLKGHETIEAIRSWEQHSGHSTDGELSDAEMQILNQQVANQEQHEKEKSNPKSVIDNNASDEVETPSQTPQKASKMQIKDIEELSALNHIYSVCSNYRDLGHSYSYAVRDDLNSNYDKVSQVYKNRIKKQTKCLGIDDVELLQRRADKAYEESDDGKTITVGIAGAMGGLNSPDSASEYCNMSSGASLIISRKLEKEVFNKETCKYE